jgi:hypothetical protein
MRKRILTNGAGQRLNFLLSFRLRESINDNLKDRIGQDDTTEKRY